MRALLALATTIILVACGSAPLKPEKLEVTQWQIAGDRSAQPITLQFDAAEKRVSGFAGCNRFGGSYMLDQNQLSFGSLMSTKMACADAARNKTEQVFLDALARADSFVHTDDSLTLYDAHAAQLLRFRAVNNEVRAHDAQ